VKLAKKAASPSLANDFGASALVTQKLVRSNKWNAGRGLWRFAALAQNLTKMFHVKRDLCASVFLRLS
jgi:hypothetical protein